MRRTSTAPAQGACAAKEASTRSERLRRREYSTGKHDVKEVWSVAVRTGKATGSWPACCALFFRHKTLGSYLNRARRLLCHHTIAAL